MASKTTEWRPGPTVCRCCLTEGCYKDISTEYFWMGKREVYAEMLSETFDLSIAYSQSGGPNSHSRLICEPCISRLRDAADFKRQVQECERTFMQYLDPGSSLAELEVGVDLDKEVKVERVKEEKEQSDDDEFDDRPDFGDDDDYDDLDDQPLTKLASKVPKKESVDVLDLIDNAKVTVKRKSSSKTKVTPAKKAKTKKDIATSSKEKPEPRKKKGDGVAKDITVKFEWRKVRRVTEDKANAALLLECSNAVAFRWMRGKFMCAYCPKICANVNEIRSHSQAHDKLIIFHKPEVRNSFPLRIDITNLKCSLCDLSSRSLMDLKTHLITEHEKNFNSKYSDGVIPFVLTSSEYRCVHCDTLFESYMNLFSHMNEHYQSFVCYTCGKGYSAKHKLRAHQKCHETGKIACPKCDLVFVNHVVKNRHVAVIHGPKKRYRCPVCDLTFKSCHSRLKHLDKIHGQKREYRCNVCPSVFGSGTSRYSHMRIVHNRKKVASHL
nr:zinc finger and BTB domain-containing protein 41-like isoform X14 [Vanessa tameamea]